MIEEICVSTIREFDNQNELRAVPTNEMDDIKRIIDILTKMGNSELEDTESKFIESIGFNFIEPRNDI